MPIFVKFLIRNVQMGRTVRRHLVQLELIQLQLQIATYTIATYKKPATTEKAVQCDSFLDI